MFYGKTDEENSLVCKSESVPDNVIDIYPIYAKSLKRTSSRFETKCTIMYVNCRIRIVFGMKCSRLLS